MQRGQVHPQHSVHEVPIRQHAGVLTGAALLYTHNTYVRDGWWVLPVAVDDRPQHNSGPRGLVRGQ